MCRLIRLAIAAVVTGVLVWLPDVARPVSRSPVPTDPRGRHHRRLWSRLGGGAPP